MGFTGVARGVLAVNLKGSLGLSRVFGDIISGDYSEAFKQGSEPLQVVSGGLRGVLRAFRRSQVHYRESNEVQVLFRVNFQSIQNIFSGIKSFVRGFWRL